MGNNKRNDHFRKKEFPNIEEIKKQINQGYAPDGTFIALCHSLIGGNIKGTNMIFNDCRKEIEEIDELLSNYSVNAEISQDRERRDLETKIFCLLNKVIRFHDMIGRMTLISYLRAINIMLLGKRAIPLLGNQEKQITGHESRYISSQLQDLFCY